MTFEGPKPQSTPKPMLTMSDLLSDTPVNGLGYERFSPQEKMDYEALLSQAGTDINDPALAGIKNENARDILTYVRLPVGSPDRSVARDDAVKMIKRVVSEYYDQEDL
jgi:hypothetical protein